jgi:hypothetical protein
MPTTTYFMSERAPVTIDPAQWTQVYEMRKRDRLLLLHRKEDNVFLVYAESSMGLKAGFLVESGGSPDVVRAVRRACGAIHRMDLVSGVISKLPAEKL